MYSSDHNNNNNNNNNNNSIYINIIIISLFITFIYLLFTNHFVQTTCQLTNCMPVCGLLACLPAELKYPGETRGGMERNNIKYNDDGVCAAAVAGVY
jgi:hypothetical protein